jgi:NADH-quinone oxidoreductase subunit N
MSPFAESVRSILPECLLVATACLQFLIGPFLVTEGQAASRTIGRTWSAVSLAALGAALWLWYEYPASGSAFASAGAFRSDPFSSFFRGVAIVAGVVLVLINWGEIVDDFAAEFHGLLLLIIAGVSLTAAANDLIVLFLALELVSIPTYVFLYLPRREAGSPEATTKYFLLSIFSSAIVLYGFSFLYGAVGTTHLGTIHQALVHSPADKSPVILLIAAACIVAGLSFRVTAVPFHFYAPDVFQGSHAGAGALLAFVPKIAGFVALLRILRTGSAGELAASSADSLWLWCGFIFALMSVASMFLGNVLALLQRNLKRLLAYSSIAHAGYMLVGLAVGGVAVGHRPSPVGGVPALLFYLIAYGFTIAGVFGLLVLLRRGNQTVETVDDLAGLSQTHPAAAAAMAILLFSLTGLPPTAGFLGKLNLLMAAWSQGTFLAEILAVLLAVNAAIAATYYLRIVAVMYLRPPAVTVETSRQLPTVIGVALCVAVSLGLFFFPGFLWDLVDQFVA